MDKKYLNIRRASLLGIVGNIFLFVIKFGIGMITNSQSMIADAINSFSDVFSSIMTFVGNKIASIPRDDDHNLGHGKAEYIYSLLISIVMFLMAMDTGISSIESLIYGEKFIFSVWLVIICMITIVVKFCLYLYTNKLAKKYDNILIRTNSIDHRNDCVVTIFNLGACLLSFWGIYFVDGIVGIGISIWIILTAVKIFKESYDVLMDKSISNQTKSRVYKIIEKHSEIKKVIHFNSTPVGYRYQISFTIYVDGNLSTWESHDIANELEREIEREISEIYLTVIHVNPI